MVPRETVVLLFRGKIVHFVIEAWNLAQLYICICLIILDMGAFPMGHFRVAVCLSFEVSLGAQLL